MSNILLIKGAKEREVELEELKDEIAACLEFENLNFLIGAGASSYIVGDEEKGIATMSGLAKEFYAIFPDIKIGKEFAKDKFPNSLEDLLNYLIALQTVKFNKKNSNIIMNIKRFIFRKVTDNYNSEVLEIYKNFYLKISNRNRNNPVNIFTTNYDLYNETALDELKFNYNNGFAGSSKRIFNPNIYNYVLVENLNLSKKVWKSVDNFFNLYKIHGSVNWTKQVEEKTNLPVISEKDIDVIKQKGSYDSLMIYPSPQKDRSTLMTPYSDLFRLMQNNLLKPNSILIVIGYSFGDEHINRMIFNALSVYDFRLVVFGNSEHIQRIKEIGDSRIWIINSPDKIHYFSSVVNSVLPELSEDVKEMQDIKKSISKLAGLVDSKVEND